MDKITLPDDPALRPQSLADFIGQPRTRALLSMSLSGTRSRGEQLDHLLLHGPPGLGKTTLAKIIAAEANAEIRTLAAPSVARPGDLRLGPGELWPRRSPFP